MNDLHRLLEDAAPEPVRGLSAGAVLAAARRRQRLRAGAVGLALALVLGGVGTAFAVTRDGRTQVLQPVQTPAPTATASTSTVYVGVGGGFASCPNVTLVPRTVPGPPTVDAALRSLFSGLTPEETAAGRFSSLFGRGTAGLLQSVETYDGFTYINLDGAVRDLVRDPGRCDRQQLSAEVNRTLEAYRPYMIRVDGDEAASAEFFGGAGAPSETVTVALSDVRKRRDSTSFPCSETVRVARPLAGESNATAALRALLATAVTREEEARGLSSVFGSPTAGILRSVHVVDGIAYVDLVDIQRTIPNVSTSCGGAAFRSQMLQTLAPYGARELRLAINGDPRLMADFLQAGCGDPVKAGDPCDPAPFASPSPFRTVKIAALGDDCSAESGTVTREVLGLPTAEKVLNVLFAGSTPAEREQGSLFGAADPGLLRSLHQVGNNYYVDLQESEADQGSYGTSCGGAGFFTLVRATLEQLGPVDSINFAIEGDVRRFVEITQGACAEPGGDPPGQGFGTYDCDPAPFQD